MTKEIFDIQAIERFYFELKTLSEIKPNYKLVIEDNQIKLDPYTIYRKITRFYNNHNRNKTIDYLRILFENVRLIIKQIKNDHKNLSKYWSDYLIILPQVIKGLENLKYTYNTDDNIKNRISFYQEIINNLVSDLKMTPDSK